MVAPPPRTTVDPLRLEAAPYRSRDRAITSDARRRNGRTRPSLITPSADSAVGELGDTTSVGRGGPARIGEPSVDRRRRYDQRLGNMAFDVVARAENDQMCPARLPAGRGRSRRHGLRRVGAGSTVAGVIREVAELRAFGQVCRRVAELDIDVDTGRAGMRRAARCGGMRIRTVVVEATDTADYLDEHGCHLGGPARPPRGRPPRPHHRRNPSPTRLDHLDHGPTCSPGRAPFVKP